MNNKYTNLKLLSILFLLFGCNWSAFSQSGGVTTYNYTGSVQTYTVPRGITHITVNAEGAEGGLNSYEASFPDSPGHGACVFDTLTVTVGQVINIVVGGKGANGAISGIISGGYNGGGNGANNVNAMGGGGTLAGGAGGGASDIRVGGVALANRIIVAAGGGGSGLHCANTTVPFQDNGGDGGGLTGEMGIACSGETGGGGGTPVSGGLGGDCSTCSGLPGSPGTLGTGGSAGVCCAVGLGSAGGGGGGGLWGGGGGDWTGGGGGSDSGSIHAIHTRGCNAGNGLVVISPVCNTPGISGATQVCAGLTTTLTDDTTGGTWSSSDGGTVITIGSSTGLVTGVSAGTTIVTYIIGPCAITTVFTVNPLPIATTGADTVCAGLTTTLGSVSGPGAWSSSNTAVGSVGSASGTVTGIMAGTTIITYTLAGTGCINTTTVLVDPLPAAITGADSVCAGLTTALSDITAAGSGTWSSSNTTVDTVGLLSGIVTGISAGTSLITYTIPTGACIATVAIKVNPLPNPVSGADTVCVGSTVLLSDGGGGAWASSATTVATIGSSSGTLTGVHAGSTIVTYTLSTGCITVDTISVRPLPSAIFGPDSVCVGLTDTLINDSTGGIWTSSNSTLAYIGSLSGVVTGLASGNPVITYTLPTSCIATTTFVVHPLPGAITGEDTVCSGLTTTLSDTPPGGTWSSSDITTAIVGAGSGIVTGATTGIVAGTATITYKLSTGCIMTTSVLVNPLAPITGASEICRFSSATLSDFVPGGSWSSGNTAIGTVDPVLGTVTGVAAGTTIITYLLPATNCASYYTVKVDSFSHITGTSTVCQGLTANLHDFVSSGTWTSSNMGISTVNPLTGVVTGIAAGVDTITYTLPSGCAAYMADTTYPLTPIFGNTNSLCVGFDTTLTDTTMGGSWSSSNAGIALISPSSGIVFGESAGTATITYTLPTGCAAYFTETVAPLTNIGGTPSVCLGSTITLTEATGGGMWSISNMAVGSIGTSSGSVTGVGAGTATITYTLGTGCTAYTTLTVYPVPVPISGADTVCMGLTTALSDASSGGTWSGGSGVVVPGMTGITYGAAVGTGIVTYTLPGNCQTYDTIEVNPLPASITGGIFVCQGLTTTLGDASVGGTWSSSNLLVATIGSLTGLVTAVYTGTLSATTTIDYTLITGCSISTVVTVNPLPNPISYGTNTVCQGQTLTYMDATSGGTWTSGNTAVATVGSGAGIITGVSAGTAAITYTLTSTGCIITSAVIVDSLYPITGPRRVCFNSTINLTDTASGGAWSSSNPVDGSISASGVVTGVTVGTTIISYLLPTGCLTTKTITINPLPKRPNPRDTVVCEGLALDFFDTTAGGTWASANTTVATIGSGTGTLTAVTPGTSIITYILTATGCYDTTAVTVFSLAPITGPDSVCAGSSVTLSDTASGGTWQSGNLTVATIGTSGIVMSGVAGTSIISYTLGTGCRSTVTLTVDPLPFTITGPTVVCQNSTITLFDVTGTGTWSSGDVAVGSITPVTGVFTGVSAGTAIITYMLSTGCYLTTTVAVNPVPAPILGTLDLCQYNSTLLTNDTLDGTWSSSNAVVASIIPATGELTANNSGTATITYSLATSCYAVATVTVNAVPPIIGPFNICSGSQITLTESLPGTWSSGDAGVAAIGATTGIVTGVYVGVSAATATITYTFLSGCPAYAAVTVNPLPAAIGAATTTVCQGQTIDFTDATGPGGTWSTSNVAIGSIGNTSGVLTGTGGGTLTVTYTLPTGCYATISSVVVNPITPILGVDNVCVGSTTTLSDATGGGAGVWSSSNTVVATITGSGVVSGIEPGTSTITWQLPTGCSASVIVTVDPLPANITGPAVVCAGATIQLLDGTGGGGWTSGNTTVATVGGTGIVTGMSVLVTGTAIITYKLPTTCYATYAVTVNPAPGAITGAASVCVGTSAMLGDAGGGTWLSSNTAVGTIGSTSGIFQGITIGNSTVTYTLPATGCYITRVETVNSLPSPITGTGQVCVGAPITLSDATVGGTWTSQYTLIATVLSSGPGTGVVTGVGSGIDLITYTLGTSCYSLFTVTVLPQPVAVITPLSDTFLCPGGVVALTASTGTGLTYQWYDGLTVIPGATTSSYIDSVAGEYAVLITQTSTGCAATSVGINVTINPVTASIFSSGSDTSCSGSGILLSVSPPGLGYQWVDGSGPITGATAATYTATVTGSYAAVVSNTVGCSVTTDTIATYITPSLPGILTLSGALTFCSGDSVTLTGDAGYGITYQWTNASGPIPGATNISYTTNVSGTYNLVETNSLGCTTVSPDATVAVTPLPRATVSASDTTTFCAGGSVTLSVPFSGVETYQWYDYGSAISGATGNSYFTTATGRYQVMVDSDGCSSMAAATSVAVVTTPALVPLTPSSFCWGGSSYLSAVIVGGASYVTYMWYLNGVAIPGATASTYTASVAGDYSVAVNVPGGCFEHSSSATITEKPLPDPVVTYAHSVFHVQSYFVTYEWYKDGSPAAGVNDLDTLIAYANGTYKVQVTDTNGCQSISDNSVLTTWTPNASAGVAAAGTGNDVRIYPNPARTIVHVDAAGIVRAVISSIDGKVVIDQADARDINIVDLADGMYIIVIYDQDGQIIKTDKLLKATN